MKTLFEFWSTTRFASQTTGQSEREKAGGGVGGLREGVSQNLPPGLLVNSGARLAWSTQPR